MPGSQMRKLEQEVAVWYPIIQLFIHQGDASGGFSPHLTFHPHTPATLAVGLPLNDLNFQMTYYS